jgi:thiamine-monophosphate kinase
MAPPDSADEFDIIARYFAPLATAPGARKLIDDAAVVNGMVVTTDAIVEGVHFLPGDPLDLVARKALRVNLSDLAAKGARPLHYLLTLAWPKSRPASEIAQVAAGLAHDQQAFEVSLLGGDTVSTPGPLMLSITAFGEAGARTPSRADAKVGDDIWVTGTIGDAALGLAALRGENFGGDQDDLIARYRLPAPPLLASDLVADRANASMDISDGLIADAGKIAKASGVCVHIQLEAAPLSAAARRWLKRQADEVTGRLQLASFGDDYQMLFTAPTERAQDIQAEATAVDVSVTRIGAVRAGAGVQITFEDQPVEAGAGGYVHRLGS